MYNLKMSGFENLKIVKRLIFKEPKRVGRVPYRFGEAKIGYFNLRTYTSQSIFC
jgi:hypothetical protein